ncbi:hypothetical protein [Nonomuraea sp. KM88]
MLSISRRITPAMLAAGGLALSAAVPVHDPSSGSAVRAGEEQ